MISWYLEYYSVLSSALVRLCLSLAGPPARHVLVHIGAGRCPQLCTSLVGTLLSDATAPASCMSSSRRPAIPNTKHALVLETPMHSRHCASGLLSPSLSLSALSLSLCGWVNVCVCVCVCSQCRARARAPRCRSPPWRPAVLPRGRVRASHLGQLRVELLPFRLPFGDRFGVCPLGRLSRFGET